MRRDIDQETIHKAACHLHSKAQLLKIFFNRRVYKIGKRGGYFANAKTCNGPSYELNRLARAAPAQSSKRWIAAWAGVSANTHQMVITQIGDEWKSPKYWDMKKCQGFSIPGFSIVVPRAEYATRAIAAAREALANIPAEIRRKRRADPQITDFVELTGDVYQKLTGRPLGVWSRNEVTGIDLED